MRRPENIIDRVISFVNPEAAFKRIKARDAITEFTYAAARPTRERELVPTTGNSSSESGMNQRDRIQLIWESRSLCNNFPLIKGILRKLSLYSFSTVKWQQRTDDQSINSQYEEYLENWAENCDVGNRHNLTSLTNLIFMAMIRDGDMGVVLRWGNGMPKLQLIEADRIGRPLEAPHGMTYIGGITIDPDTGSPISYRVYDRTREGIYQNPTEIPANMFLHIFDPMRIDQVRGVTSFEAAIDTARDIYDIMRYEKFAVKWASAQTGVVTRHEQEPDQWETGANSAGGNRIESIDFGKVNYLESGESIQSFMSNRPNATFSGFIQTLQRDICHCLGAPYGFFVDNSALGGNTSRMDSEQANRVCERYQNLIVEKFLNNAKNAALAYAISQGILPPHKQWRNGKWQFPAHPTADVGRDSNAAIEEYKMGLRTAADIYGEQSKDWEEEFQQIAVEQNRLNELAKQYNLPVERLSQRSPNPTMEPDGDEQQKPDLKKKELTELARGKARITKKDVVKAQRSKEAYKGQSERALAESKRWEHLIGGSMRKSGIVVDIREQQKSEQHDKLVWSPSDIHATMKMSDGIKRKVLVEIKAVGVCGYKVKEVKVTARSECRELKHKEAKKERCPFITIAIDARKADRDKNGNLKASMSGAKFFVWKGTGSPRLTTNLAKSIACTTPAQLISKIKSAHTAPVAGNDKQNKKYFSPNSNEHWVTVGGRHFLMKGKK